MISFENAYGEIRKFPDLPTTSESSDNLFELPIGTVFQLVENGKVRKNARHFVVTDRRPAECYDYEGNLYRYPRIWIAPIDKATGKRQRDFRTGRYLENFAEYGDPATFIPVKVVRSNNS